MGLGWNIPHPPLSPHCTSGHRRRVSPSPARGEGVPAGAGQPRPLQRGHQPRDPQDESGSLLHLHLPGHQDAAAGGRGVQGLEVRGPAPGCVDAGATGQRQGLLQGTGEGLAPPRARLFLQESVSISLVGGIVVLSWLQGTRVGICWRWRCCRCTGECSRTGARTCTGFPVFLWSCPSFCGHTCDFVVRPEILWSDP